MIATLTRPRCANRRRSGRRLARQVPIWCTNGSLVWPLAVSRLVLLSHRSPRDPGIDDVVGEAATFEGVVPEGGLAHEAGGLRQPLHRSVLPKRVATRSGADRARRAPTRPGGRLPHVQRRIGE